MPVLPSTSQLRWLYQLRWSSQLELCMLTFKERKLKWGKLWNASWSSHLSWSSQSGYSSHLVALNEFHFIWDDHNTWVDHLIRVIILLGGIKWISPKWAKSLKNTFNGCRSFLGPDLVFQQVPWLWSADCYPIFEICKGAWNVRCICTRAIT